jgi:hypothetical protein
LLTIKQKVKQKLLYTTLPWVFKLLVYFSLYKYLSILIVNLIEKSTRDFQDLYGIKDSKGEKINVLVFMRALFEKDIIELHKRTNLKMYIFPNEFYTMLADAILPVRLRHQLYYNIRVNKKDFRSDELKAAVANVSIDLERDEIARKKMDLVVKNIIHYIINRFCIHSMITSNINYYQDQSWQNAFIENKLKIFVLFQEFYGTKYSRNQAIIMGKELGLQFMGNFVFVFCEWAKEILTRSGEVKEERIIVTGGPRTDIIYDMELNKQKNKKMGIESIVLFDFLETGKEILFIDTMKIFSKMASLSNNSNVRFIVKTKTDHFKNILQNFCNKNSISLNGIKVSSDFDQEYFINNSICFIGYQTSALVEYMHTNIPILNLNWAEAEENVDENMFIEESAAYQMIRSDNDLKTGIESIIKNTFIMPNGFKEERKKIIEKFLYKIDGKRSISIANKIINTQAVVK